MNDTLRWLLGIDALRLGQEGVELGFERPVPAWGWALIAFGAIIAALIAYRRLEGSALVRGGLGTLRALLILAMALLLAGPRLIKPNETEEKDWVLVLVDRSLSMTIPDAPGLNGGGSAVAGGGGGADGGPRVTREQQLRVALEAARPTWQGLQADRVVVWLGFDGGAFELSGGKDEPDKPLPELGEPTGRRTDVDRAVEQALRRGAGRPVSGVVLLSDGRSVGELSKGLLRRLEAEKVPVFSVALGSAQAVADVAVGRVESPRSAFVSDMVPVQVELSRTPAMKAGESTMSSSASVLELIDTGTGVVLDTREVDWLIQDEADAAKTSQQRRITLTAKGGVAGSAMWRVRVRPKLGGADMIQENDAQELAIELVDRPLRVAYFDGYPRWEYRYLTSLLVREKSVSSAITLLAPGRRYLQEGTVILDALPTTHEQWSAFDVIIMGDVLPSVFTGEQLAQIKHRVAVGGAGLVWIGGESATPALWRGTALGDLLPMSLNQSLNQSESAGGGGGDGGGSVETLGSPALMTPTPAAERLGVLRLSDTARARDGLYWPDALSDPNAGWPMLYWVQRIEPSRLKPTAEVLATCAEVAPEGGLSGSVTPAVIAMRFGAGRSVYVATDEIWRWRYGRGELLPERFWLQIIRLLGRESLSRSGRPAVIDATPESAQVGQAVRISVTLLDQALVEAAPQSVQVRVRRRDGAGESAGNGSVELTLAPEGGGGSGAGGLSGVGGTRSYAGTWVPSDPGKYAAEAPDPVLSPGGGQTLTVGVEVWQADDELRQPQADHGALERLAQASGGKVLLPEQIGQLPKLLPNRRLRLAGEPEIDTLWDSPLALLVVIGLLTLEWVGRRLMRLV